MINRKEVRILYFGTPEISSYVLLNMLLNGYNVIGVVTKIDKEVGRNLKLEESPVKKIAKKFNIPVFQYKKIKEGIEDIKAINPELILTLAFGQIIPHEMLMIPKYGCLNLHGSILPSYRGASPIQTSLLNGDKETGMSLMEMVDEMDAGRVYGVKKIRIEEDDNCTTLNEKMKVAGFACLEEYLDDYLNGNLKGEEQDISKVTFTHKILSENEKINFNNSAESIFNKIRALAEKPGAYFIFNNLKFKVLKGKVVENDSSLKPGTIIEFNKKHFIIKCEKDALEILLIQKEGKKVMNFTDFYNGNSSLFKEKDIIE